MTNELSLDFRHVGSGDAPMLLAWRNDGETLRNSRRSARIEVPAEEWLETFVSERPARKLYITLHEGIPIGLVYTDFDGDGYCEISYIVAPEHRGRGLGIQMVGTFVRRYLAGVRIKAFIYEGNTASENIAISIGLRPARHSSVEGDPRVLVEWQS